MDTKSSFLGIMFLLMLLGWMLLGNDAKVLAQLDSIHNVLSICAEER